MSAVRLIIALALLAFFVRKAATRRIYLLGLPFLMYMGESVFFDKVKVFWMPQRLGQGTLVMIWLTVVWVMCMDLVLPSDEPRRERRVFGPPLRGIEEIVLGLIGATILVSIVVSCIRYGDIAAVLWQASGWIFMIVGYFMVRGIVAASDPEDVTAFLYTLVVMNAAAAVLFVVHQGLGVPIYTGSLSSVEVFRGQVITRGFTYFPSMLLLTLAMLFAKPRWRWADAAILVANMLALAVSYTRSWVLIGIVVLGAELLVQLLKARGVGRAVRRLGGVALVGVVVAAAFVLFLPTQYEYFVSRFAQAQTSGGVAAESSFVTRSGFISRTYRSIARSDSFLGAGFSSGEEDSFSALVERWSADTLWVPVLYRLGMIGAALFLALFLAYGARAFALAMGSSGPVEYLGIVLVGMTAGMLLGTLVSWSVVNPNTFAMGLWPFALLSALAAQSGGSANDEGGMEA